jgi:hypothetical protein
MKPAKRTIPQNIGELLDHLGWMLLKSPTFVDKTGYFPFLDLDYVFEELNEGLTVNRTVLGDARYQELMGMSDRMRALFEADPEDRTGETATGCKIILEMEDVLKQVQRKS